MTDQMHPTPKFILPSLQVLLQGENIAVAAPDGISERIRSELEGDAFFRNDETEAALMRYTAARSKSWRIRVKMAMCCLYLRQWGEAVRLLDDAQDHAEALPLAILIECINMESRGDFSTPSARNEVLIAQMLGMTDIVPYCYEIADRYTKKLTDCVEVLRQGHAKFPSSPNLRRRYARALWRAGAEPDSVIELVQCGVSGAHVAPADLWLGYEATRDYGMYAEAFGYLAALRKLASAGSNPLLDIVEADTHLVNGDLVKAEAGFEALHYDSAALAGLTTSDAFDTEMSALRGLIHIAIVRGDNHAINAWSEELRSRFLSRGVNAVFEHSSPLESEYFMIKIDGDLCHYATHSSLLQYRSALMKGISDDDTRALVRVLIASYCGPDEDDTKPDSNQEVLLAGQESAHPAIQRNVAWARMEEGDYLGAGDAFAAHAFAFLAQSPNDSLVDADFLFDDPSHDTPEVVGSVAVGVLGEFQVRAATDEESIARFGHEIIVEYLRTYLLKHKLYPEFLELMTLIVCSVRSSDIPASASIWFDYGLACHFCRKFDDAAAAYRECLALSPDHDTAKSNLLMLIPPADQARVVIERQIDSFSSAQPWASAITEISFADAVYLLTLVRACGGLEQDRVLQPFEEGEHPFTPTAEMRQHLFSLLRAGLVRISKECSSEAFEVNLSKKEVTSYHFGRVLWELPLQTVPLLREIEAASVTGKWPAEWREQAADLAQQVAKEECMAYLQYVASERAMIAPAGEKTVMMIENLLSTYSVGQVFGIFWSAAAKASDFKQRKGASTVHAANTIVGNCQRHADRARAENWDLKIYSRPKDQPRSQLSYTLHDAFLRSGHRCFSEPVGAIFEGKWPSP